MASCLRCGSVNVSHEPKPISEIRSSLFPSFRYFTRQLPPIDFSFGLGAWKPVHGGRGSKAFLTFCLQMSCSPVPDVHYFTLNAGTAPPFSMNVHLPSAHTRFSISIRFNWTYCSGDRPIACR